MFNFLFRFALVAALPFSAFADTGAISVPDQVSRVLTGFEHPETARSPNRTDDAIHRAVQPIDYATMSSYHDATVVRVEIIAGPAMHTCLLISRGDGQGRPEMPCAHYLFPDGRTGPLQLVGNVDVQIEYATAPRVLIDVLSRVNFTSCMGHRPDACRFTEYHQVVE